MATVRVQPSRHPEVHQDARDDPLLALSRAHELLQASPISLQNRLLVVVEAAGRRFEPTVDGCLTGELLGNIARLVLQVEDNAVTNSFLKLVGVDVGAEEIPCERSIALQQTVCL